MIIEVIDLLDKQMPVYCESHDLGITVSRYQKSTTFSTVTGFQNLISELTYECSHYAPRFVTTNSLVSLWDCIMAIILCGQFPHIYRDGEAYDLTFACAFPLYGHKQIQSRILSDISAFHQSGLLVYQRSNTLSIFPFRDNSERIQQLLKQNQRLMKKWDDCLVTKSASVYDIFEKWNGFYLARFEKSYTSDEIQAFMAIITPENAYINNYWINDKLVCSNLIYVDSVLNTHFDVLAPWDLSWKRYRPGFFSIIYSLQQAYMVNKNYSLCYGDFLYKQKLMSSLEKTSESRPDYVVL